MLLKWAKVDTVTGMIVEEGLGFDEDGMALSRLEEPGIHVFTDIPDGVSGATHYRDFVTDEWVLRPEVSEFLNPYDLTQLPTNTVVHVTDESGTRHEITDLTEPLTLEGPQKYRVDIKPPAPYLKIKTYFEVP